MKAKLKEIALYYGVGTSTMRRWLAVADIKTPLGRRMYTPKEMLKFGKNLGAKRPKIRGKFKGTARVQQG